MLAFFFFENNRYELAFENIASILGGIFERGNFLIKHYRSMVSHTQADTSLSAMTQSKVIVFCLTLKDFIFSFFLILIKN